MRGTLLWWVWACARGLDSFRQEEPLSAQSLMRCWGNLQANAKRNVKHRACEVSDYLKDYQECLCNLFKLEICGSETFSALLGSMLLSWTWKSAVIIKRSTSLWNPEMFPNDRAQMLWSRSRQRLHSNRQLEESPKLLWFWQLQNWRSHADKLQFMMRQSQSPRNGQSRPLVKVQPQLRLQQRLQQVEMPGHWNIQCRHRKA